MRPTFFQELYKAMEGNENIFAITGDLGYGGFDFIQKDFPERFINCGAAEFAMVGISAGLALEGKIPFVYSITPFLLYRPFEMLRTYINHEKIPIKLVGSGRDKDYAHDGYSHHAEDAKAVLDTLPNIVQMWPETKEEIPSLVQQMITNQEPTFISLKR
jgi:transketolase